MRRLFIMRKDLNMSPGKLAAQVGHCAEAYWTRGLRENAKIMSDYSGYEISGIIDKEIFEQYISGTFTKTICEARNKNHLLKAKEIADEIGLIENIHYGLIYDSCFTELTPEEDNGTTLTGIWFCPLNDDIAHYISKKYHLYITGDTHGEFNRLGIKYFPEQREMTRDDIVIICGDFGLWHDTKEERYWLKWLAQKKFTIVFCDGNHENYDRIYSDEFPIVDFHGGKAQQIRKNIFHLMRGYIFNFDGKKFFVFGGAKSHDIQDGILNIEDYTTPKDLVKDYNKRTAAGQMLRINHISWWEQEVPSDEEMQRGISNLEKSKFKVDYVISHTLPQSVITCIYGKKSVLMTT